MHVRSHRTCPPDTLPGPGQPGSDLASSPLETSMARHIIYFPDLVGSLERGNDRLVIGGDEAHHLARVKRLEVGDGAVVCDGLGRVASMTLEAITKSRDGWTVTLHASEVRKIPAPSPRVVVLASPPKGDHLSEMIDGLSQAGCAAWRPLITTRTIVDPREGKLERLARTAIESLKQCGRAHLMELGERIELRDVLAKRADLRLPATLIVADEEGGPVGSLPAFESCCLLVGPEGGLSNEERESLAAAGAIRLRVGPHTLRSETAAVVACAAIMSR